MIASLVSVAVPAANTWASPVPFLAKCVLLAAAFVVGIELMVALVWPVTDRDAGDE